MSQLPTYLLERTFNAPRTLVWKAWTDPKLLARWYGPNVETVIHKLDVTPGGLWLNEMKMGGNSGYQRAEFTEVQEPEKLVCLMSNADADWNIASNPMMPDWPKTLLTVVTFKETANKTEMRLEWTPHNASAAEIACFEKAMENMGKGWGAGMELLAELLAELAAG
jgi:uncharacterized protein YndB with AHSA1/START domain